jgi:hypothetical protein
MFVLSSSDIASFDLKNARDFVASSWRAITNRAP